MSIWYCDKHDTHTDLDWHSEGCPKCEQESIELEELAEESCQDFPDSTCEKHDGTGLWCDPCLARAALAKLRDRK